MKMRHIISGAAGFVLILLFVSSTAHAVWSFSIDERIYDCLRHAINLLVADTDGDGAIDLSDNCDAVQNPDQADADGDLIGDACDDDDGDGLLNADDNCPSAANADQADLDDDGAGDVCDEDVDGDGVANDADNCPDTANTDQADADADGAGDACDDDVDGDGVANDADNCPDIANADQADADADGAGDACDPSPQPVDDNSAPTVEEKPAADDDHIGFGATADEGGCALVPDASFPVGLLIMAGGALALIFRKRGRDHDKACTEQGTRA